MYPQLGVAVDARAVFDVVAAAGACDPQGCSSKLHQISVRDRFAQGILRRMHWVNTRDMLVDGLTKGGIDRISLHKASHDCHLKMAHPALTRTPISVGSATKPIGDDESYSLHRWLHRPRVVIDCKAVVH